MFENLRSPNGEIVLGRGIEKKKLAADSVLNSRGRSRIRDMAIESKDQVVQEIKSAAFGLFSIQFD